MDDWTKQTAHNITLTIIQNPLWHIDATKVTDSTTEVIQGELRQVIYYSLDFQGMSCNGVIKYGIWKEKEKPVINLYVV